jgi:hypothetical protein
LPLLITAVPIIDEVVPATATPPPIAPGLAIPTAAKILRHARKTIHRLLNWTDYTPAFFRLCAVLNL